jgi:hypothetical protein
LTLSSQHDRLQVHRHRAKVFAQSYCCLPSCQVAGVGVNQESLSWLPRMVQDGVGKAGPATLRELGPWLSFGSSCNLMFDCLSSSLSGFFIPSRCNINRDYAGSRQLRDKPDRQHKLQACSSSLCIRPFSFMRPMGIWMPPSSWQEAVCSRKDIYCDKVGP